MAMERGAAALKRQKETVKVMTPAQALARQCWETTKMLQGFGETGSGHEQTSENSEGPALASDGTEQSGGDLGRFRKGRLSLVKRGAKSREETPKEGPRPDDAIAGTKLRIRDAGGPAHDGTRPDEAQIAMAIAPTLAPTKPPMSSPAIMTPLALREEHRPAACPSPRRA
jgi:hypothetical protein